MSIHPEGKSCSDLGRVLVLNDPPTRLEVYGLLASIITFNCGILYLGFADGPINVLLTLCVFAVHGRGLRSSTS